MFDFLVGLWAPPAKDGVSKILIPLPELSPMPFMDKSESKLRQRMSQQLIWVLRLPNEWTGSHRVGVLEGAFQALTNPENTVDALQL